MDRFSSLLGRRDFLKATAVAAASATPLGRVSAEAARKPNVVIMLADDLGYGDLGCYGNPVPTPSIDALAAEGLRFTDFHSNGPVCSPTRAALLTGCYQQRWGIQGVFHPGTERDMPGLPPEAVTFAEALRSAGYGTAMFGKWHLGYPRDYRPTRQGFDTFRGYLSGNVDYHSHVDGSGEADWWKDLDKAPETGYSTDLITDHGVRFIEAQGERPFCLYLAHEAPHFPYQGRNDQPVRVEGRRGPGEGSRNDQAAVYREMVAALDEGVAKIVSALKRMKLERNTLLFFCSDNGARKPGSNSPLNGWKGGLLEGGHRVPAVAWWPGHVAPGVTGETTMTMDLFPTMLELAGSSAPDGQHLDGTSLLSLLTEGAALQDRTLFWRTGPKNVEKAVRQGPWKLLVTGKDTSLFNLDEDLGERRNLAGDQPGRIASMRSMLAGWEALYKNVKPLA